MLRLPTPPVGRLIGFVMKSYEVGHAVFEMEVDDRHHNPMGTLHGGIYCDLADAAMGFVLMNKIQIITGSLDGTSGFLLSLLMCRAMNRSAFNVLFGAFGQVQESTAVTEAKGTVRSIWSSASETICLNPS